MEIWYEIASCFLSCICPRKFRVSNITQWSLLVTLQCSKTSIKLVSRSFFISVSGSILFVCSCIFCIYHSLRLLSFWHFSASILPRYVQLSEILLLRIYIFVYWSHTQPLVSYHRAKTEPLELTPKADITKVLCDVWALRWNWLKYYLKILVETLSERSQYASNSCIVWPYIPHILFRHEKNKLNSSLHINIRYLAWPKRK